MTFADFNTAIFELLAGMGCGVRTVLLVLLVNEPEVWVSITGGVLSINATVLLFPKFAKSELCPLILIAQHDWACTDSVIVFVGVITVLFVSFIKDKLEDWVGGVTGDAFAVDAMAPFPESAESDPAAYMWWLLIIRCDSVCKNPVISFADFNTVASLLSKEVAAIFGRLGGIRSACIKV
jgi:hypothetical protein